jgi:outer membrane protein OmpA-like peptidoglycan-associated protein
MAHRRSGILPFVALCVGLITALGCSATPPPKELVDARASFTRASKGVATKLAPAELDTAKQALAGAEAAFEDDPEGEIARDLAYIADRKALLAEAMGALEEAERAKANAEKGFQDLSQEELARARGEVDTRKQQLDAERRAREDAEKGRKEAEAGRKEAEAGRREAERIANAALASLKEVASVKEEKRGVVITLSGAVLFASGKSDLLPIAKEKITQVAKTLKDQGSPPLRIEGHTDAKGSAAENRRLSLARADSVKAQLVSDGLPGSKITTVGHGPDRPVADNNTPDGRANNRRVEIIVNPTD